MKTGSYEFLLRWTSNSSPTDTAVKEVKFKINIVSPFPACTQVFTDPVLASSYTYYIESTPVPLKITFTGLSNTTCNFDTTIVNKDGSAIDSTIYSYT
jgi:hypothetical protein